MWKSSPSLMPGGQWKVASLMPAGVVSPYTGFFQLSRRAWMSASSLSAAALSFSNAVASGVSCQYLRSAAVWRPSGGRSSPPLATAAMAGPPTRSTSAMRHWSCRSCSAAVSVYQS